MSLHLIPDAFSSAECTRITTATDAAEASDARLVGGDRVHNIRRADLVWIDDLPELAWVADRLIDVVRDANRHFHFDLDALRESPQVARYTARREGHFDWHSDIGDGPIAARRKLTLVVQLSPASAYDGGTLELRPSLEPLVAPLVQGTAVVFPAFVLHRVAPVTRGTRHSLTIWAHGPAFR